MVAGRKNRLKHTLCTAFIYQLGIELKLNMNKRARCGIAIPKKIFYDFTRKLTQEKRLHENIRRA